MQRIGLGSTLVLAAASILAVYAEATCAAEPPATRPAAEEAERPWEAVKIDKAAIAVPRGWRSFEGMARRMVLFRQGDGLGVPLVDETGAPIQIGLTIEKFPGEKDTLDEGIEKLIAGAKQSRRLEVLGEPKVETLALSDGTDARLLTLRFLKEGHRGSLQMKLLTKDADGNGWVVSGFLVSGKDSKVPTPESGLAVWLRAHVVSFCFDGEKLDAANVSDAYEARARAEASE